MCSSVSGVGVNLGTRSLKYSNIEQVSEYSSNAVANPSEGADVTVIDHRPVTGQSRSADSRRVHPGHRRRPAASACGPRPARPPVRPLHYRAGGVGFSTAPHRRPVSTSVTIALAGLAALITLWLGSLAQLSGGQARATGAAAQPPDRLAVVVVRSGESLSELAGRVAPDAPVAAVVERIRGLNQLQSVSVDAGQTLIAPVG